MSQPNPICDRIRERLPEFADGALAGRALARLQHHLSSCPRCRAEVDDLRALLRAARSVGLDDIPPNLIPDIQRAVRRAAPGPAPARAPWLRIALPASAAVGLIALALALRTPPRATTTAMLRGPAESPPTGAVIAGRGPRAGRAGGGPGPRSLAAAPSAPRPEAEAIEQPPRPTPPVPTEIAQAPPSATMGLQRDMMSPAEKSAASADAGKAAPAPPGPRGPSARDLGRAAGHPGPRSRAPRGSPYPYRPRGEPPARREPQGPTGAPAAEGAVLSDTALQLESHPPAFAFTPTVGLARLEGRPAICLQFAPGQPTGDVAVMAGRAEKRRTLFQGRAEQMPQFVLSAADLGPGPSALPITIQSQTGARSYLLFAPTTARLGEVAPSAPVGRYTNRPAAEALADFSALTGLILLVQEPLEGTVSGDLPTGSPQSALQELASRLGLQASPQGEAAFLLVPAQ